MFAVQADGAEVTTIEGLGGADGALSAGAGRVPRRARAAVRVLHARLRRVGHRVPRREPRLRPTTRSARGSRATSAAAPATRASSRRATSERTRPRRDGDRRAVRRAVGRRREDPRLLTGHGRYVDDVVVPGMLHAAFVRSDVARGRITRLDVEAARALAGCPRGAHRRRPQRRSLGSMQPTMFRRSTAVAVRAAAPARRRRRALRRRPDRDRRRREPLRRRGRVRARRGRLRAARRRSSTPEAAGDGERARAPRARLERRRSTCRLLPDPELDDVLRAARRTS